MKKKNVISMLLKKVTVAKLNQLKGGADNHGPTTIPHTEDPNICQISDNPKDCAISVDPRQDDLSDTDS